MSNMNIMIVALKSEVNIIMKFLVWLNFFNACVLNMPFYLRLVNVQLLKTKCAKGWMQYKVDIRV
jgi:hypothetical protein